MHTKKAILIFPYADPEIGAPIARIKFYRAVLDRLGFKIIVFSPSKKNISHAKNVIRFKGIFELFNLIKKESPHIIITSGPPATIIFVSGILSKILKIPFFADVRDPWVRSKTDLGLIKEGSFKQLIHKMFERTAYFLSKKIFVVSKAIKFVLEKELNISPEKIVIIEHSVNINKFKRDERVRQKIRSELNIDNRHVLIYVGNPWVGVHEIVENISNVIKKTNSFMLLILSRDYSDPNDRFKKIEKAIKFSKIENNVKVFFNIPHNKLPDYLSAADLGLNLIPDNLKYLISNKIKEYIACGVPVACKCNKHCYSREFITQNRIGFVTDDWQDFTSKLENILKPKRLDEFKKYALLTSKKFSYEKIGEKLAKNLELEGGSL